MSNFKPKQQAQPDGIIFGEAFTASREHLTVLIRGEHSVYTTIFVDMFRGTLLLKVGVKELKKLREALNKAIEYMESK